MSMSDKCHACGRGGYDNAQLDALLGAFYNDDPWYNDYPYEWWSNKAESGRAYWVPAIGDVKLIHRKTESGDGYSAVHVELVFEIDGQLYKESGSADSYESRWDGEFRSVEAKTRPVVYYE